MEQQSRVARCQQDSDSSSPEDISPPDEVSALEAELAALRKLRLSVRAFHLQLRHVRETVEQHREHLTIIHDCNLQWGVVINPPSP
jgi:hypothetical protein